MASVQELIPAIKQVVQDIIKTEITPKIDKLEKNVMSELAIIKDSIHKHAERLDDHETRLKCYEKSLQFHSKQVDDILTKSVPNLERKLIYIFTQK